jgi:hypothetical protein
MYAYPSDVKLSDDIGRRLAQQQFGDFSFRGAKGVGRLFLQVAGGVLLFVIGTLFFVKIG